MQVNVSMDIVRVDCYKCGVSFWVETSLNSNWRRDKTSFYCPNGHGQSYTKSTAEILQEKLDTKERRIFTLESDVATLERTVKRLKRKPRKKHAG